ncbi:alpha/beta hydrolase fold domain-containing protein [Flavisolibacter nicotianae]|uniref:alpha/beta hydrolase fold domain-containing protein n=1 Tax=Flavisolibacter nicotianae TaxID=2364882 RepID=UPI000EAEC139|nr:alpha/beta hydrolase fold domain-containing protein [Flavisolibacter nicotianae]
MKSTLIFLALVLMAFCPPPKKKIKVYLIGDSTLCDYEAKRAPITGWGMPFRYFFDSSIVVDNRAKGGRSTRTFLGENRWQPIVDSLAEGDYTFIQFGHNDEAKEEKYRDRYTPVPDYKSNLVKFITETRSKKAIPVLVTPVSRMRFVNGIAQETHTEYTAACYDMARQYHVPLIDLDRKSRDLYNFLGEQGTKQLFMQLAPGENPSYPEGQKDNTHFNEYGARRMAELVLQGIRENGLELAERVVGQTTAAPSTVGLTQVPDTSYTNFSAYRSSVKTNPAISLVEKAKTKTVKAKKNIAYCEIDQRSLQLDVFYPAAKAKTGRAAILIIHGGGWRSGNRSQHHALAQRLAERGYVCFTPAYRLSTESLFPAAISDLKNALRWVRVHAKEYGIDTTKVAVLGFSAGGELAAFLGTTANMPAYEKTTCGLTASTTVNAVVDLDGTLSFVHPESGEGDDTKKISAATYWFGYSKKENPLLWAEASPLTHVSSLTPPTLFINSGVERMHAGRNDYRKALRAWNIYTDVKTFADAPHSFPQFAPWFEPTVRYTDEFLQHVFSQNK